MSNTRIYIIIGVLSLFLLLPAMLLGQGKSKVDSLKNLIASASDSTKAKYYIDISNDFKNVSSDSALVYSSLAIESAEKSQNPMILGDAYITASKVYADLAAYKESTDMGFSALKIFEQLEHIPKKTEALNAIAYSYYHNADYERAIKWWTNSYTNLKDLKDSSGLARACINLGAAYSQLGDHEKSLELYEEGLQFTSDDDELTKADIQNNMGFIFINEYSENNDTSKLIKSIPYLRSARDLFKKNNDSLYYAYTLFNLGSVNLDLNNIDTANSQLMESISIFRHLRSINDMTTVFDLLSEFYYKQGQYKLAHDYKDSVYNLETRIRNEDFDKAILELDIKYQTAKREKERQLIVAESEQRKIYNNIMAVGLIFLLILTGLFIYQFLSKRKANRLLDLQNKTILSRNKEISKQRDKIRFQNNELISSINYARRIQEAVLPRESDINAAFSDSFVIYMPKDIVSGDFYWLISTNNKVFWAVADCTGHGVPGAFLSILGATGLKKIVQEYQIHRPSEILTQLTSHVLNSLKEAKDGVDLNDGMDIALCCWDKSTNMLEFAGAYNPLYLIRSGEALVTKATRRPIGSYSRKVDTPFENHEIELKRGDRLYIFSDGFTDQFGEKDESKYSTDRFRDFLVKIHAEPMSKQRDLLIEEFKRWKGNEEQIDDICILGVQI